MAKTEIDLQELIDLLVPRISELLDRVARLEAGDQALASVVRCKACGGSGKRYVSGGYSNVATGEYRTGAEHACDGCRGAGVVRV